MIRNFFAVAVTLFFLSVLSQTARACSCSAREFKSIYSSSDAVFIGKVSKITIGERASIGYVITDDSNRKPRDDKPWKTYFEKVQNITLDVIEPFKGVTEKTFALSTSINVGSSCGTAFSVGESYLVLAYKSGPRLSKDEIARPKESWTLETRLKAEADKFNAQSPLYATDSCSRTGGAEYLKEELDEIRNFQKNGVWKKSDRDSLE